MLNAPSTKIMFLWNFYHLFLVLCYEWNTNINGSFQFFGFCSRNYFLERGLYFSIGGFTFKWEMPQGGHQLGGGGFRKITVWCGGEGVLPMPPHNGKSWEEGLKFFTLFYVVDKTFEAFASKNTAKFKDFTMPICTSSGFFLSIKFCIKKILITNDSNLQ